MPYMNKYGKHTDFTGFVIMVEEAIPSMTGSGYDTAKVRHTVKLLPTPEPGGCDLCMPGVAVYAIESPWLDDEQPSGLLQCQSCTVDCANAMDNPDEWVSPHA